MNTERKRKLVRAFERYIENPPIRAALRLGIPVPMLALLETQGRRSGRPRHTPVINGLVDDEFWVVAEHGDRAAYVRNLLANPRVRVKRGRRWRDGTAEVLRDDDALARAGWIATQRRRPRTIDVTAAKVFGAGPVSVRIRLDRG